MNTDPIADLLTRIRNAQKAHHQVVRVPHSTIKENILKILKQWNFIQDFKVKNHEDKVQKELEVLLKEDKVLTMRKISKPGQRIYVKKDELRLIKSGLGISIVSTSKGLMTNIEAKKQNMGGELICEIY